MEPKQYVQFKRKRLRIKPSKKWTVDEEKALIQYLLENRAFEKPWAQLFYKRFCEEKNLNIDWKVVRSKVKNMRISYNRTKDWLASLDANSIDEDMLKSTLLKKCNYFQELDEIFGHCIVDATSIGENLDCKNISIYTTTTNDTDDTTMASEKSDVFVEKSDIYLSPPSPKGISSTTAGVSDIMKVISEKVSLKQHKLEQDLNMQNREMCIRVKKLALKEKKLELKEKQLNSREKIRILKINSEEKLKIMEMEMNERLAREELKLKYK